VKIITIIAASVQNNSAYQLILQLKFKA